MRVLRRVQAQAMCRLCLAALQATLRLQNQLWNPGLAFKTAFKAADHKAHGLKTLLEPSQAFSSWHKWCLLHQGKSDTVAPDADML